MGGVRNVNFVLLIGNGFDNGWRVCGRGRERGEGRGIAVNTRHAVGLQLILVRIPGGLIRIFNDFQGPNLISRIFVRQRKDVENIWQGESSMFQPLAKSADQ